ncbi:MULTISPECIES: glycosyltransferase family 4 protein [Calothrix]|uniref:Glycosyltransferase family 4 protein n=2 Tax=Calothrix TaxID=1186 RepID=A0ABR8A1P7_9CYAN|nr:MULTISPECIES: glycosyltransferase family 4 protein [Calothrix]MBD2193881.1 glycosyltransferase family 4 protein [Calothrix parietina FACHB-288]MBD2222887.1 glycosyltransferase family 4 protein [Calothrix anomala FACHB-343]
MDLRQIVNLNSTENQQLCLDKIRVLVLLGGSELFGHERATIEIFRTLSEIGLKVRFVISSRLGLENIAPYLDKLSLEWIQVPFGYHWYYLQCAPTNLWGVLATNILIWREVQRWQPTHLYTGNWLSLSYAAPFILLSRLPFVYRAGDEIHSSKKVHQWFNRLIFHRVSFLVCNCKFLADKISQKLPFLDPVVIYNSPPYRPEKSINSIEIPKLPQSATLILYVGQISEHKGVPLLIKSMIKLILRGQNVVLWLAGNARWNPELIRQLRTEVKDAGLEERICFLDYVEDTQKLFELADIHVCPSIWDEPSPNVVFEAKQAGVPSVVFPVGGIPELIEHKVNGYICKQATVDALVEGLTYFLEHPKERYQAAEAARASLQLQFSQEKFQQQWAKIFIQSCKNK